MKRLLILSVFISPLLLADDLKQSVTPSAFYSTDNDNFDVVKVGAEYAREWEKDKQQGVKYETARFSQNGWNESIDTVSYTFANKYDDKSMVSGNVGLDTNSQVVGGAEYEQPINANFTGNVFAERQIVDSKQYIVDETYYNMVGGVVSYDSLNRFSAAGVLADQAIEDGNNRIHFRSRLTYTLLPDEGIHASLLTKHFTSSKPSYGDYFNPARYNRYLVGLSRRKWFDNGGMLNIGAYTGPEYVNSQASTDVQLYEVQYIQPIDKNWKLTASGAALVNSNSYDYNFITMAVTYSF